MHAFKEHSVDIASKETTITGRSTKGRDMELKDLTAYQLELCASYTMRELRDEVQHYGCAILMKHKFDKLSDSEKEKLFDEAE